MTFTSLHHDGCTVDLYPTDPATGRRGGHVGGSTGNLVPRPVVMESGWSELRRVADHREVIR